MKPPLLDTATLLASIGIIFFAIMSNRSLAAMDELNGQASTCRLIVDGKKYIDGTCPVRVSIIGNISDITFGVNAKKSLPYWGIFSNEKGSNKASVYWNGSANSTHAQSDLGELVKNGDCWSNQKATVCLAGITVEEPRSSKKMQLYEGIWACTLVLDNSYTEIKKMQLLKIGESSAQFLDSSEVSNFTAKSIGNKTFMINHLNGLVERYKLNSDWLMMKDNSEQTMVCLRQANIEKDYSRQETNNAEPFICTDVTTTFLSMLSQKRFACKLTSTNSISVQSVNASSSKGACKATLVDGAKTYPLASENVTVYSTLFPSSGPILGFIIETLCPAESLEINASGKTYKVKF